jgi:hypothetical protein
VKEKEEEEECFRVEDAKMALGVKAVVVHNGIGPCGFWRPSLYLVFMP